MAFSISAFFSRCVSDITKNKANTPFFAWGIPRLAMVAGPVYGHDPDTVYRQDVRMQGSYGWRAFNPLNLFPFLSGVAKTVCCGFIDWVERLVTCSDELNETPSGPLAMFLKTLISIGSCEFLFFLLPGRLPGALVDMAIDGCSGHELVHVPIVRETPSRAAQRTVAERKRQQELKRSSTLHTITVVAQGQPSAATTTTTATTAPPLTRSTSHPRLSLVAVPAATVAPPNQPDAIPLAVLSSAAVHPDASSASSSSQPAEIKRPLRAWNIPGSTALASSANTSSSTPVITFTPSGRQ